MKGGVYRMLTDEQAIFNAFSGKLLFHGKEEFYEKCTSKR